LELLASHLNVPRKERGASKVKEQIKKRLKALKTHLRYRSSSNKTAEKEGSHYFSPA